MGIELTAYPVYVRRLCFFYEGARSAAADLIEKETVKKSMAFSCVPSKFCALKTIIGKLVSY